MQEASMLAHVSIFPLADAHPLALQRFENTSDESARLAYGPAACSSKRNDSLLCSGGF